MRREQFTVLGYIKTNVCEPHQLLWVLWFRCNDLKLNCVCFVMNAKFLNIHTVGQTFPSCYCNTTSHTAKWQKDCTVHCNATSCHSLLGPITGHTQVNNTGDVFYSIATVPAESTDQHFALVTFCVVSTLMINESWNFLMPCSEGEKSATECCTLSSSWAVAALYIT